MRAGVVRDTEKKRKKKRKDERGLKQKVIGVEYSHDNFLHNFAVWQPSCIA